ARADSRAESREGARITATSRRSRSSCRARGSFKVGLLGALYQSLREWLSSAFGHSPRCGKIRRWRSSRGGARGRSRGGRRALAGRGALGTGAACRAGPIELALGCLPLLSRRIVVKRRALDEPAFHLVVRPDGSTNLDGIAKPARPGARAARPMDFAVHELA